MDCIRNGRRQYRLQQTVDGRRQFRLQETVGGSRYNEDGSMWAGCTVSKCVTRNTEARDSGHNLTINETTIVWPSQWVGVSLQEITDLSVFSSPRAVLHTITEADDLFLRQM